MQHYRYKYVWFGHIRMNYIFNIRAHILINYLLFHAFFYQESACGEFLFYKHSPLIQIPNFILFKQNVQLNSSLWFLEPLFDDQVGSNASIQVQRQVSRFFTPEFYANIGCVIKVIISCDHLSIISCWHGQVFPPCQQYFRPAPLLGEILS